MRRYLASTAFLAAGAVAAQTTTVRVRDGRPVLSAPAQAAVAAFEARTAPFMARFKAIRSDLPLAAGMAERVAVEQGLRGELPDWSKLNLGDADRNAAAVGIWSRIDAVDTANTAWLKSVLPADGWFRRSRDGDETAHGAWLIVQHSPDPAFMREVAERMRPLAEAGEVRGADYALLFDRTEGHAGRPQYYGSQYHCEGGRWVPDPIRDPAGVEARRRALRMSTMTQNAARINERGC